MQPRCRGDLTLDVGGLEIRQSSDVAKEIDEVEYDQIEVRSYAGGLVKSFERKAA